MTQPHVIVLGNEKGGAGKSTLAIHIVTGLLHAGRSVAIIDLDLRQRSMQRFFLNRQAWLAANAADLPQPMIPDMGDGKALAKADEAEQLARFDAAYAQAVKAGAKADRPLKNEFWGDRIGTVIDPFGHKWSLATHVEEVGPEEIQRRMQEWSQSQAGG